MYTKAWLWEELEMLAGRTGRMVAPARELQAAQGCHQLWQDISTVPVRSNAASQGRGEDEAVKSW